MSNAPKYEVRIDEQGREYEVLTEVPLFAPAQITKADVEAVIARVAPLGGEMFNYAQFVLVAECVGHLQEILKRFED